MGPKLPVKKHIAKRKGLLDFADMSLTILSRMPGGMFLRRKAHNHSAGTSPRVFTCAPSGILVQSRDLCLLGGRPALLAAEAIRRDAVGDHDLGCWNLCGVREQVGDKFMMLMELLYQMRLSMLSSLGSLPAKTCKRTRSWGEFRAIRATSPPSDVAVGDGGAASAMVTLRTKRLCNPQRNSDGYSSGSDASEANANATGCVHKSALCRRSRACIPAQAKVAKRTRSWTHKHECRLYRC